MTGPANTPTTAPTTRQKEPGLFAAFAQAALIVIVGCPGALLLIATTAP